MTPILSLEGVGVHHRGRTILNDISLTVERGTVTMLGGPNGAGKSTLLGIALGLLQPSVGKVQNLSGSSSYLPERFTPPSGMNVNTYLRWIAGTRKIPRRARDAAVSDSLTALGFTGSRGPMRKLSKGNLQRVGIASALIGHPELVVLDEPFTGMDARGTELLARAIDSARVAGSTLLLVHHGPAAFTASKSLWLKDGTVREGPATPVGYRIHAETSSTSPSLPGDATVARVSSKRVIVTASADVLERTLRAVLDAGWTVHGVEPR